MINKNKITICMIFLMLISCSDKKEKANKLQTSEVNVPVATLSDTNATVPARKPVDTLSNKNPIANEDSEIGFYIMENESIGKLKYGLSLQEAIAAYGKPSKETKAILWGADGEYHQTIEFTNKGIELDVIGDPGTPKKVNSITISNPSDLKTLKKIGIGSDYTEVENAYKDQIATDFSNEKAVVIGSIYGGLIFTFENDKVTSIFIGSAAE